ncbi:DUF427 domain-containing protein [Pseudokineococcus basanitobsidens]|uniref:DUF427 domain-containing protein n=1 Tax=Pseudokineococcus basanitobsidens TaxID=1926649 RepID=A0ABU8RM66_9ACTN
MATRQQQVMASAGDALRYEPIGKRVRAALAGGVVLDTTDAVVVWEPRRLLCQYAVPEADLRADLTPAADVGAAVPEDGMLGPDVPFAAHTAAGTALDLSVGGVVRPGAAFRPEDGDLDGMVLLDFDALGPWWHEEEENVGHARDPFHRIDTLPSTRRVRVERDGELVALSTRAMAVFEAQLPPRFYLPREDVVADLAPTGTKTACPYKGWSTYWTVRTPSGAVEDAAWSYETPLHDVVAAAGYVCFDDGALDVTVDAPA